MRSSVLPAVLLFLAPPAYAQNYPDIRWKTAETEHFVLHYYDDVSWSAAKVAEIAEKEVYPGITGIYGFTPARKTHLVIRDDEDRSNGFAVYNLGWITLWTSPSTLQLRGRHDWIRGVVSHEFSHLVSLQASSPAGWLVEGIRAGGVSNDAGNSNVYAGGTVLVPTHAYPRWWAEGTAQLDSKNLGFDTWDTQRDMLLRAATIENNVLTFDEMRNITVREHFGGEMVYNQGFSFLSWLNGKFGPNANVRVAKYSAGHWRLDFDTIFRDVFGADARDLYDEWRRHLQERYDTQLSEIRKNPAEGARIPLRSEKALAQEAPKDRPYADGTINSDIRFSPDGRWLSVVTDGTLKLRYLDTPFVIPAPAEPGEKSPDRASPLSLSFPGSFYSWAPDSTRIVLSRRKANIAGGYPYFDLYLVDLGRILTERTLYLARFGEAATERARKSATSDYLWRTRGIRIEPKRITHKLRATHVAWSPDGKTLAFSQNRDGARTLRLVDPDGRNPRDLLRVGGDSEATGPVFSPDGKTIAFTYFHHGRSDIRLIGADGTGLRPLTADDTDDRDPCFAPDGKSVVFASDRTGIFQLYEIPVDAVPGTAPRPLSQVETGAFQPFATPDGKEILYIRFSSFGFKPYRLLRGPVDTPIVSDTLKSSTGADALKAEAFPPLAGHRYWPWLRPLRIFPTLIGESEQFKAGVAVQLADWLEKHQITALGLFGRDQDYQIFYENRMFYPTLTASYTAYVRSTGFKLVDNQDGVDNEPEAIIRDSIQFVSAGIAQEFYADGGLAGRHRFDLTYNKRYVDRRVGVPVFIDNAPRSDFRLLSNDGVTLSWTFRKSPNRPGRDQDINPRGVLAASASYSFVHTGLATPDTTIPAPNRRYFYHEGTLSVDRYFALPWTRPWWNQHTFWVRFDGGFKSRNVNINDEFFLGGRLNYRAFGQISSNTLFYGYRDFSISGETLVLFAGGYTFPIARAIDRKFGWFYFDSVFGAVFAEAGNAWTFGDVRNLSQNRTRDPSLKQGAVFLEDIGAEVRLKMALFTDTNDWKSVFRVAYGFQDDAAHGFSDTDSPIHFFLGIGTSF